MSLVEGNIVSPTLEKREIFDGWCWEDENKDGERGKEEDGNVGSTLRPPLWPLCSDVGVSVKNAGNTTIALCCPIFWCRS